MKKIMTAVLLLAVTMFAQPIVEITQIDGAINGISDNGKIVTGYSFAQSQAFYWTQGTGFVYLGTADAFGVSNDTIVAGRFLDPNTLTNGNPTWVAAYYKNGQWHKLSGIPGVDPLDEMSYTHAYSINAQGSKLTGMAWRPGYKVEACYWSIPDTGIGLLGMVNNENSRADDISNDGSKIVGWNAGINNTPDRTPYYWDPIPHFMGSLDTTWNGGECNGISPDGNILVGTTSTLAFQYTNASGMEAVTDPTSGYWGGWASDVSNNGTVVGHFDPGFFDNTAFIKLADWQYATSLKSYLADTLGVTGLTDYFFYFNKGISADGKVFAGELSSPAYPSGGGFIISVTNVLPVELTSFTAKANGHSVILNWSTATETNNQGFEIERKSQNTSWITIGFVAGSGTTTENRDYSFIDNSINSESYLYRLKQIDFNGSSEYSNIVEITANVPAEYSLSQNYPNPFNPATKIKFTLPEASLVKLKVFNSIGEEVANLVNKLYEAGSHEIVFNASNLTSGIYFVRMESGSFVSSRKITLLK